MLRRRHRNKDFVLNTTSTADISFMLLIFFLITSSLDIDQGLSRQLPPPNNKELQDEQAVDKEQLMELKITADNQLLVDGQPFPLGQLRDRAVEFIRPKGRDHLISVSADPQADYDSYFQVQNELMAAYRQLRDEWARRRYRLRFDLCSDSQKTAIRQHYPQRIAEVYASAEKGGRP